MDTNFSSQNSMIEEVVEIFKNGMNKFKAACNHHIPFGIASDAHIKYIPERCLTTYFSWSLINSGFDVFNEQSVDYTTNSGLPQRFDLFARRFDPSDKRVQIKVEAKGNLDSEYNAILNDINRMEKFTIRYPEMNKMGFNLNKEDDYFPFHINGVITTNWGLPSLTEWWVNDDFQLPKGRRSNEWSLLKEKLLKAKKRGKFTILESNNDYYIDVLYAFFSNS